MGYLDPILHARRVLVVEDDYFIADDISREMTDAGAIVIGPFGSVGDAIAGMHATSPADVAVLDVDLGGEMVYAVADLLLESRIPIVFATGYDRAFLPARFRGIVHCEKPIAMTTLARAIGQALAA